MWSVLGRCPERYVVYIYGLPLFATQQNTIYNAAQHLYCQVTRAQGMCHLRIHGSHKMREGTTEPGGGGGGGGGA